jgi:hypothetical protein
MAGRPAVSDSMTTDRWMDQRRQQVAAQPHPLSGPDRTSSYFGYVPELTEAEHAQVRAQQAEQHRREEEADKQNRWMLIPVFAPDLAILGAEGVGAYIARKAAQRLAKIPVHVDIAPKNGNTYRAILGKRAHADFRAKVRAKADQKWIADGPVETENGYVVPDAQTPPRSSAPDGRLIDLKPNTARGRAAGAKKKAFYEDQTERPTRIVYYDPNKYRR